MGDSYVILVVAFYDRGRRGGRAWNSPSIG